MEGLMSTPSRLAVLAVYASVIYLAPLCHAGDPCNDLFSGDPLSSIIKPADLPALAKHGITPDPYNQGQYLLKKDGTTRSAEPKDLMDGEVAADVCALRKLRADPALLLELDLKEGMKGGSRPTKEKMDSIFKNYKELKNKNALKPVHLEYFPKLRRRYLADNYKVGGDGKPALGDLDSVSVALYEDAQAEGVDMGKLEEEIKALAVQKWEGKKAATSKTPKTSEPVKSVDNKPAADCTKYCEQQRKIVGRKGSQLALADDGLGDMGCKCSP